MNEMMSAAARASQTMEDVRTQLIALNMRLDVLLAFEIEATGLVNKEAAGHMLEVYNDLHRRLVGK